MKITDRNLPCILSHTLDHLVNLTLQKKLLPTKDMAKVYTYL